jgi:lysophospholipase L1-like esterase
MPARRTPRRFLAGAVTLAAALVVAVPTTVAGGQQTLVALGDSYASGVGTRVYDEESGSCRRSPYAYPVRDAERLGLALTFVACSGATTRSVRTTQLDGLGTGTDFVTVTVGGNDVGFVEVITACAPPWWASDCHGEIDEARQEIRDVLPSRLDQLYAAIRDRAPTARVVVVGYPRLFMGEDCNAGTWFSPSEQKRLNATADLLSETIESRAVEHGFRYVDPRAAYTGHAVCDDVEWVNGLSNPVRESYHPNRRGQRGYANLVDDHLT